MTQPVIHRPHATRWLQRCLEQIKSRPRLLTFVAGFGVSLACAYALVARPLARQIDALQARILKLSDRMDSVAAYRGSAQETSDLLSALAAQQENFIAARESLAMVRQFRSDLETEARATAQAAGKLSRLAALQQQVIALGGRSEELQQAVAGLAAVQAKVAVVGAAGDRAVDDLERAQSALTRLGGLTEELAKQKDSLAAAEEVVAVSMALQQSLAASESVTRLAHSQAGQLVSLASGLIQISADDLSVSSENAAELLALHDILANTGALQIPTAENNLRSLLSTHTELLRTTPHIAAAAENLDLLCEFQDEMSRQLESIEQLRTGLTEITLLKETVARVHAAITPLIELSSLRRQDAAEVRSMAREMLERRTAQLSPLPCEINAGLLDESTAAMEPVNPAAERVVPEPRQK